MYLTGKIYAVPIAKITERNHSDLGDASKVHLRKPCASIDCSDELVPQVTPLIVPIGLEYVQRGWLVPIGCLQHRPPLMDPIGCLIFCDYSSIGYAWHR